MQNRNKQNSCGLNQYDILAWWCYFSNCKANRHKNASIESACYSGSELWDVRGHP